METINGHIVTPNDAAAVADYYDNKMANAGTRRLAAGCTRAQRFKL
jgi:hypothetical protein